MGIRSVKSAAVVLGAVFAAILMVVPPAFADAAPVATPAAPLVDHHMHIFSPESARVLKISCARLGPVRCPPEISTSSSTGQEAVEALDAAGIKQGVLLSTGYFFGSPEVADLGLDIPAETRAENTFVVSEAKAQCGRLVAFISVDPLRPNALDEINYWGRRGGAAGLKLHLGNSAFDFRSPDQVKKLAAVFRAAARWRFPIVVHLQTRTKDFGAKDVAIFLKDVAPYARGAPIQIAHAAAGGGIGPDTLSALGAFADAINHDPAATKNLFFDLAMVPDEMSNTQKLAATPANIAALKVLIYRIGLKRFVLGSDWTYPLGLVRYYADEREALKLPDADWAILASNVAPYIAARQAAPSCSTHTASIGK